MTKLKVPITSEDHIQGPEKALISLVEYGDFQCPFCGMAHPIIKRIQNHFGNNLQFIFRNFPLTNIHPYAKIAAETAEFANVYDRFWEMHDLIFENQQMLSPALLLKLAEELNLSQEKLELAIEKQTFQPKIQKDFMGGVRSGVNGTPTFFINEERYNGPMETLESAIESLIPLAKQ